jgi:hypothetical protein
MSMVSDGRRLGADDLDPILHVDVVRPVDLGDG